MAFVIIAALGSSVFRPPPSLLSSVLPACCRSGAARLPSFKLRRRRVDDHFQAVQGRQSALREWGFGRCRRDREIFTTTLKSPDNKTIIVPNSKIRRGSIVNYNAMEQTRLVDLPAVFNYKDDFAKIEKHIQNYSNDSRILKDLRLLSGRSTTRPTSSLRLRRGRPLPIMMPANIRTDHDKNKELFDNNTVPHIA